MKGFSDFYTTMGQFYKEVFVRMPSEKILKEKEAVVASIAEDIKNAATVVFVDARGLTVDKDTELRAALRKADVSYKVRKNTLTSKAVAQLGLEGVDEFLKGPTAIAACPTLTDAARIINDFAKENKAIEIKGGIMEGKAISAETVKELASLPSKEVLIARLLGSLNGPITGLTIALNEYAKKLEA